MSLLHCNTTNNKKRERRARGVVGRTWTYKNKGTQKKTRGHKSMRGACVTEGKVGRMRAITGPKKGEKENRQHELSETVQHADENKGKKENSF